MQLRIKATGFKLTPSLEILSQEKLLVPLEKRLGSLLQPDNILEVELAKVTKHHEEGKIWKCEANLALPRESRTIYVRALSESLEAAIDEAKDELWREVGRYKEKRLAKFLRFARQVKEELHVTRLARRATGVYRWLRRK